jgi:hypothetical protein
VPATHPVHAYRTQLAAAARDAGLTPTGDPLSVVIDADNIGKAVLDALQDVVGDDTCVARLVVEKSYGTEARTTVRVR